MSSKDTSGWEIQLNLNDQVMDMLGDMMSVIETQGEDIKKLRDAGRNLAKGGISTLTYIGELEERIKALEARHDE